MPTAGEPKEAEEKPFAKLEKAQNESNAELVETSASIESCDSFTKRPLLITHEDKNKNTELQLVRDENVDQSGKEEMEGREENAKLGNDESDDFETLSYDDEEFPQDSIPPKEKSPPATESPHLNDVPQDLVLGAAGVTKQDELERSACDVALETSSLTTSMSNEFVEMTKSDLQDLDVLIKDGGVVDAGASDVLIRNQDVVDAGTLDVVNDAVALNVVTEAPVVGVGVDHSNVDAAIPAVEEFIKKIIINDSACSSNEIQPDNNSSPVVVSTKL